MQHLTAPSGGPLRERLSWKLAYSLRPVYFALRKNRKRWTTTIDAMRAMPPGSLGRDLATFLDRNQLQLMEGVEWHDVYHVLFDYDTTICGEGCIQFVPMGNGRWSAPFIACNLFFLICYPEHRQAFLKAYRRGKAANRFHDWDLESMLEHQTIDLRSRIFGAGG